MAKTEKGVYYQNDGNAAANILEDMKKMAESVDAAIGKTEGKIQNYDDTEIKQTLNSLNTTLQNNIIQTHIVKVTTEIKELEEYELPCQYTVRKWRYRNILQ